MRRETGYLISLYLIVISAPLTWTKCWDGNRWYITDCNLKINKNTISYHSSICALIHLIACPPIDRQSHQQKLTNYPELTWEDWDEFIKIYINSITSAETLFKRIKNTIQQWDRSNNHEGVDIIRKHFSSVS